MAQKKLNCSTEEHKHGDGKCRLRDNGKCRRLEHTHSVKAGCYEVQS